MHGSVSVGSTFAQSNSQENLSLDADLTYQGTGRIFGVTSDVQFSSQEKVDNTSELTVKSQYFAQLRKSKSGMEAGLPTFFRARSSRSICALPSAEPSRACRFYEQVHSLINWRSRLHHAEGRSEHDIARKQ